jgi:hypothetical protein
MTTYPEALRLADQLEAPREDANHIAYVVAEELRRLHALNAELLEALKSMVNAWEFGDAYSDVSNEIGKARAAIAKAEGQQ